MQAQHCRLLTQLICSALTLTLYYVPDCTRTRMVMMGLPLARSLRSPRRTCAPSAQPSPSSSFLLFLHSLPPLIFPASFRLRLWYSFLWTFVRVFCRISFGKICFNYGFVWLVGWSFLNIFQISSFLFTYDTKKLIYFPNKTTNWSQWVNLLMFVREKTSWLKKVQWILNCCVSKD